MLDYKIKTSKISFLDPKSYLSNHMVKIKMEISNTSHPFFTGKMKFVDTAGRIDKFNKKFANTKFAK